MPDGDRQRAAESQARGRRTHIEASGSSVPSSRGDLRRAVLPTSTAPIIATASRRRAAARAFACRHKLVGNWAKGEHVIARFEHGRRQTVEAIFASAPWITFATCAGVFGPEKPRFPRCVAWRGLVRPRHSRYRPRDCSHSARTGRPCSAYWVLGRAEMNFVFVVEHGDGRRIRTDKGRGGRWTQRV